MMKSKIAFTKKDIVVVVVCLLFLVINVGGISIGGRRRAKRTVCLINLKQLTLAWTQFANDNDGYIVNGAPLGRECQADPGYGDHAGEIPWVGRDWQSIYTGGQQREECQKSAIRAGALWPYCQELKLYRCPTGYPGEMRTYAIVDGMNGLRRAGTVAGVHWIKNMTQILEPSERLVFIDQGWVTPDSFAVYFDREFWWENPPARHGGGTSVSFADGHSVWHRWKGKWTVAKGASLYYTGPSRPGDLINGKHIPATIGDFHDLYWTQTGCWGELGYTPTF
jgi:prepilin-type processing-associated H-X9-DG protein